jgi:hypothetical protein
MHLRFFGRRPESVRAEKITRAPRQNDTDPHAWRFQIRYQGFGAGPPRDKTENGPPRSTGAGRSPSSRRAYLRRMTIRRTVAGGAAPPDWTVTPAKPPAGTPIRRYAVPPPGISTKLSVTPLAGFRVSRG